MISNIELMALGDHAKAVRGQAVSHGVNTCQGAALCG